ncbi:MAG TPA: hypothetical protein VEH29_05600 [Acidimicrobiales bacterium]|nr:hypothetical protein [Acidimicrobiales bacterium]
MTMMRFSTGAWTSPEAPGRPGQPTLRVEAWLDPVVDEVGYDPRSSYVETYWLPVLGPSTTWLLRRLAAELDELPGGLELDLEELARALGLGERSGPNAPFARTIKRCVDFEMAEWRPEALAVRRHLPPLARRHLRRLPESLQDRHAREIEAVPHARVSERLRLHGRRLALSLLEFGEDRAAVEQQLMRWAFLPAVASECAAWAVLERSRRSLSHVGHPAGKGGAAGGGLTAPAGRPTTAPAGRPTAAQADVRIETRIAPRPPT